jgi:hypothetical protein
MNPLQMQSKIKSIIEENNIEYKVKIEYSIHMMRCRYKDKTITFNPDRCLAMAKKMKLANEKFLKFATLHEIGHAIDFEKGDPPKNVIEREIAAWENSRSLVELEMINEYDQFNEINLTSYKRRYQS